MIGIETVKEKTNVFNNEKEKNDKGPTEEDYLLEIHESHYWVLIWQIVFIFI